MKNLETMVEAVGDLVVINGKYIVIDHPHVGDGKHSTVVNVHSSKARVRDSEIDTIARSFCSGSGGCLDAGKTHFDFSNIWRGNPGNDPMLKKHKDPTKMVVVLNERTQEFFLVMNEDVSLAAAEKFLSEINRREPPILKAIGHQLSFPHEAVYGEMGRADGNKKFNVVMNTWIAVIKLRTFP